MTYPLKGITVLEIEGLAPTVFAGRILADFGADVTIISNGFKINPRLVYARISIISFSSSKVSDSNLN